MPQLDEASRGVTSTHHFHNVRCGIENILSLLEYNNDVVEKADQLSRRASNYITRHDLISSKMSDGDVREDADRLHAAHEALVGSASRSSTHLKTGRPRALPCWPCRLPQRPTARAV